MKKQNNFGKSLKKAREDAGLNVYEAAKLIGVSIQTIYYYESGRRNPKLTKLKRIADAYNTTVDKLLKEL